MAGETRHSVVWLHQGDHLTHPIICLAVSSLVEAGYTVSVLDSAQKLADDPDYQHLNVMRQSVSPRLFRVRGAFTFRILLVPLFRTLALRPSIIVASFPTSAAVGCVASRLLRCRFVYYPFELYGEQHAHFSPFWKGMEYRVLKRGVDAIVTQNEERGKIYTQERGSRVKPTIVRNYKRRQAVTRSGKLRSLKGVPPDSRIVLYEGRLVRGRWLKNLIKSAAFLANDIKLVFMGERERWWKESAEPLFTKSSLGEKIILAPWVPHEEILEWTADADVGIIIYDDKTRNNYYCAPGKLSDYVIAGVPVVTPNFPTIAPVVSHYQIGTSFMNPEPVEIARAINHVLSVPARVWQIALEKAQEELTWETQESKFLNAISGEQET